MHVVAVLALDGVGAFDLATPVEVFGRARLPDGRAVYRVRICAPSPEIDAGVFTLRAPWGLEALVQAGTIIVSGLADPFQAVSADVLIALRAAHVR